MSSIRKVTLAWMMVLGMLGGALALWSTPAFAFRVNILTGSFGSPGAGESQFNEPAGVAVNDSTEPGNPAAGDVYVVDEGNNRVEYFSSTGTYIGQFNGSGTLPGEGEAAGSGPGEEPTGQFSEPNEIAVDNSGKTVLEDPSVGDVYVVDTNHGAIDKFSPTGEYKGQLTGECPTNLPCLPSEMIAFGKHFPGAGVGSLIGVVVDRAGNVFVLKNFATRLASVAEFTDEGGFIARFEIPHFAQPGIAVDSNGDLYVNENTRNGNIVKYSATGIRLAEFGSIDSGNTTEVALDPSTNDLYLDYGDRVDEFGPFGEPYSGPLQTFGDEGVETLSESNGIAVDDGIVYASERGADKVDVFSPVDLPNVSIEAPSNVEKKGGKFIATLHGKVNPEGIAVTVCEYEYGTSTAYGQTEACEQAPGASTSEIPVSTELTGLLPDTTYHYRLSVSNINGTNRGDKHGEDETFTTPQSVDGLTSAAPQNLKPTSVNLTGSLSPDGTDAHYYYEYGESESYGSTTPALPGVDAGTGGVGCVAPGGPPCTPATVDVVLSGLTPNTRYHYRLVATSEYGTTTTADQEFRAPPTAPAVNDQAAFASEVSQFAAVLHGTVNPGNEVTSYHFVYGPTSAYGSMTPIPEGFTSLNASDDAVSERLAGLQAGTTYHFALVAANGAGTIVGPDETFTTAGIPAPLVSTGAAGGVGLGAATLTGAIDSHGWETTYSFQYGTTTAYGASWPTVPVSLGGLSGAQPVSVFLENLQPGTLYHYRLVASNGGGTSYGSDQTFTTGEYPLSIVAQAPLLSGAAIVFPTEQGTVPTVTPKSLTRAQKLAKALKACAKKPKKDRVGCEKQARKLYGASVGKKKG